MVPPKLAKITPRQRSGTTLESVMVLPNLKKVSLGEVGEGEDYPQHQYERPKNRQAGPSLEPDARLHEQPNAPYRPDAVLASIRV